MSSGTTNYATFSDRDAGVSVTVLFPDRGWPIKAQFEAIDWVAMTAADIATSYFPRGNYEIDLSASDIDVALHSTRVQNRGQLIDQYIMPAIYAEMSRYA